MTVSEVIERQRQFAFDGKARDLEFRKEQLKKLKHVLQQNEELLYRAIHSDFRKSKFETFGTELALVYREIDEAVRKVGKWGRPQKVWTGLANFPGDSFIVPEPFGTTLIIGAWNYPYQLNLIPLVSAMAAGNTSIVKPSELSIATSEAMAQVINGNFDSSYLFVAQGGVEISQELLRHRFDKIFFTGSTAVGKIVARAAAEHLTPVTLELGGKSPCFVFGDVDLKITAKRIAWGKILNAGQTCIAPDYLLVEESIYKPLLEELKKEFEKIAGSNPLESESYARIINKKHLHRLQNLIEKEKVFSGGKVIESENYIEPTILKDVQFSDEIMKEEIFGPILPVIPFRDFKSVLNEVKNRPKPLALYVFTRTERIQKQIVKEISFGGGAINDVVMHISNPRLPFGGVGASGMGSYHGEMGFRTFSHFKSVLKRPFLFEPPVKYPPYSLWKFKLMKWLLS